MSVINFARSAYALAITFLLISVTPVNAEIVGDRFICVLGSDGRIIELTYLNQINAVPCEIRESKYGGQTRTLWRANFDVTFCQRQINEYRAKLETLGWPCQVVVNEELAALTTHDSNLSNAVFTPSGNYPESNLSGNRADVTFYENGLANFPAGIKPVPPTSIVSQLAQDEVRIFDDWVIYLSAQTMLSIQHLMDESNGFSDYLSEEDFNSGDIYIRFQNRVEFLHSLLSNP